MFTIIKSNKAKTALINNILYNTYEDNEVKRYLFGIRIFKGVFHGEIDHQNLPVNTTVGFKKGSQATSETK
jgi:hypothetical protein